MEILLGDLKLWRKGNIITFLIICSFCVGILIYIRIIEFEMVFPDTIILIIGLIVCGIIEQSNLFKKSYKTNCKIENNILTIANEKRRTDILLENIESIHYKEVHYGGKWLEPVGYRVIIKEKEKKYFFDSVYEEGKKWESTELYSLYKYLIENVNL